MKARKAVEEIKAYGLIPVLRRDFLRLDLNESAWGCSPKVLAALEECGKSVVGYYPDYQDLLAAVSERLGLPVEQMLFSNGADDGIRTVMQTYVDAGDTVILANPSFGMIDLHARVVDAKVRSIAYQAELEFPIAEMRAAAEAGARLIGIVRPDSPTGAMISRDDLRQLLESFPETAILLDETYIHFHDENCLGWIDRYPNLIILHSFSKAYGMAGMRLGAIFSQAENISQMSKVNPPFSANNLAVQAGIAAMRDREFLPEMIAALAEEREFLRNGLERLGFTVRAAAANFLLVNLGDRCNDLHRALIDEKILIKNLGKIALLKNHCRIAIARREDNERLLKVLAAIV